MKNYEFPGEFHRLYRQAVESYAKGQRSSDGLFSPSNAIGLQRMV